MFRWLQFSDLHANENAVKSLVSIAPRVCPVDAIFLTGGVTRDGSAEQARHAQELLHRISSAFGAPLVVALGDEDRDRTNDEVVERLFRHWSADSELRAALDEPGGQFDEIVSTRFQHAASATAGLGQEGSSVAPGDGCRSLTVGEKRIGILVLNSGRLAPTKVGSRPLQVLRRRQLDRAAGGNLDAFAASHDLLVLVMEARPASLDSESQRMLDRSLGKRALILCDGKNEPFRAARDNALGRHAVVDGPSLTTARAALGEVESDWVHVGIELIETSGTFAGARTAVAGVRLKVDEQVAAHSPLRFTTNGIAIRNFRGIEALDVRLSTGSRLGGAWTCIAGVNGAGKTSVLQALAIALLGGTDVVQLGTERLARLRRRSGSRTHDSTLTLNLTPNGERVVRLEGAGPNERPPWTLAPLVLGYGATRNLAEYDDQRHSSASAATRRVVTLFDPLARVSHAEVLLDERGDSRVLGLVSRLASDVFESDLEIRWSEGQLRFTQGSHNVSALDLPDGFRSSMAWLADICAAWCELHPDADDPRAIEAIVLIDEIDLHLHPSLQRSLVPRLRKALPRVQWVVTTHSPLVLGSFDATELVALDRKAPQGIRVIDRPILGFSTNDIYEWLMGTSPHSAAIEEQLDPSLRTLASADLETALEVSPEVTVEDAERRIERRHELLEKLKSSTLGKTRGGEA